jgi:hypothetical protein
MNQAPRIFVLCLLIAIMSIVLAPMALAQIAPLTAGDCANVGTKCDAGNNSASLKAYAVTVLNVILGVIGIIALIMIMASGIRYITSRGDESETEKAKKGILYAVIGLIVVGLAAIIVNFTMNAAGIKGNDVPGGSNLLGAAHTILMVFLTLVGITALVYIIIGGVRYITAMGEESKIEAAKKNILYAVIGLIVVGLATVIVNFTAAAIGLPTGLPGTSNLPLAIMVILNAALVLAGITAVIYVIIGGVKYITSQGEADQAEEGKRIILYAVMGLIVIGISATLVNFVISAFF